MFVFVSKHPASRSARAVYHRQACPANLGKQKLGDSSCLRAFVVKPAPKSTAKARRHEDQPKIFLVILRVFASYSSGEKMWDSNPGEIGVKLVVSLVVRPEVQREAGQLVDFGDGLRITREIDQREIAAASFTGLQAKLREVRSREIGKVGLHGFVATRTTRAERDGNAGKERRRGRARALPPAAGDGQLAAAPGTRGIPGRASGSQRRAAGGREQRSPPASCGHGPPSILRGGRASGSRPGRALPGRERPAPCDGPDRAVREKTPPVLQGFSRGRSSAPATPRAPHRKEGFPATRRTGRRAGARVQLSGSTNPALSGRFQSSQDSQVPLISRQRFLARD